MILGLICSWEDKLLNKSGKTDVEFLNASVGMFWLARMRLKICSGGTSNSLFLLWITFGVCMTFLSSDMSRAYSVPGLLWLLRISCKDLRACAGSFWRFGENLFWHSWKNGSIWLMIWWKNKDFSVQGFTQFEICSKNSFSPYLHFWS